MSYFYGPVPSRRLGLSLGVDLVPAKTCTFDCCYCQLGKTGKKTLRRFAYVDRSELRKEFVSLLAEHPRIDYITLAGSGEPTLHKDLDKIISLLKKESGNKIPLCLITNSSLLYRKEVRKEIVKADLIIPSLDAVTPAVFKKINRPCPAITVNKVIAGLKALRREFKKQIWLEIMLVRGINDREEEAYKFKKVIELIKPDKVQLNLPVRPSPGKADVPRSENLRKIEAILSESAEIISVFPGKKQKKALRGLNDRVLAYIRRRPATVQDLAVALGAHEQEIIKALQLLLSEKKVGRNKYKGKFFYSGR